MPRMSVSRMDSSKLSSGKTRPPWRRRRATWRTEAQAPIIARTPPQTKAMLEEPPEELLDLVTRGSKRVK